MREPPCAAPEEVLGALEMPLGLHSRLRRGGKPLLHKRQVVFWGSVKGARVVLRGAGDSLLQIRLRSRIRTVLRKPHTHCDIRLRVVSVDFKRALVVWFGIDQSVVELVKAKTHLVGEFRARVFLRRLRVRHLGRKFHILGLDLRGGRVRKEHLTGRIRDRGRELLIFRGGIDLDRLAPWRIRVDSDVLLFKNHFATLVGCVR